MHWTWDATFRTGLLPAHWLKISLLSRNLSSARDSPFRLNLKDRIHKLSSNLRNLSSTQTSKPSKSQSSKDTISNALQVSPEPALSSVMSKEDSISHDKSRINNSLPTLLSSVKILNNTSKLLNYMKKPNPLKKLPLFTWTLKCSSKPLLWWRKLSLLQFSSSTVKQKSLKMLSKKPKKLMKMLNRGRMSFESTLIISIILKSPKKSSETNVPLLP